MIKWDLSLTTGNSEIDSQHKLLFEFFNDMEVVFLEGHGESYLSTGLPILENYAKTHFAYESECMHKAHCSVAEENDKAHDQFIKMIKIFKNKFESNGYSPVLFKEMHSFLQTWIRNHILAIDNKLRDTPTAGL